MCLSSLWSLQRASLRPPPNTVLSTSETIHHSMFFLLFGAGYAHLQILHILSTSETIHHSMFSLSFELATGCAMPTSRYYPHPKRSTTLCLPSLWSLRRAAHPKRSTALCLPSLWSLRRAVCHAHLQILSTSETIHCSMSSFSLELATGCVPRPPPDYRKSYLSISSHVPPISPQFRQALQEREREGGKSLYNTGKR